MDNKKRFAMIAKYSKIYNLVSGVLGASVGLAAILLMGVILPFSSTSPYGSDRSPIFYDLMIQSSKPIIFKLTIILLCVSLAAFCLQLYLKRKYGKFIL